MSLLQINTAIPLAEPLLEQRREQRDEDGVGVGVGRGEFRGRIKCLLFGQLIGFLIQMVSLGAYVCLLIRFKSLTLLDSEHETGDGNGDIKSPMLVYLQELIESSSDEAPAAPYGGVPSGIAGGDGSGAASAVEGYFGKDAILYTLLSVLTQIDLVVYVLIWVAFTCTMSRSGMACIRYQFFASRSKRNNSNSNNGVVPRRYVFVLGITFLVGIVLGAFGAWSAVNVYFRFPFEPILVTVAIDLVLCYMMVCCFDMGGEGRRGKKTTSSAIKEEQEQEEIEFECVNSGDEDSDYETSCC